MQRLLDPFVQDELITRFGKGIIKFVPHHPDTIYKRFVMVIDKQCQLELSTMMQKISGGMTIAADVSLATVPEPFSTPLRKVVLAICAILLAVCAVLLSTLLFNLSTGYTKDGHLCCIAVIFTFQLVNWLHKIWTSVPYCCQLYFV